MVRIPPLSVRLRTIVRSFATLARDPGRLDQVLILGQTINMKALAEGLERLANDPDGLALLEAQPRIDREHVDFDALERLPDGTLGREYIRFMKDNGITPDAFATVPDVGDPRGAYVMLRIRQTHDLWHVLTGYTPDVRGEIVLQAFTYAQLGSPSALLITIFGSVRWAVGWDGQIAELRRAYRRGKQTKFLVTFPWEQHWATPVAELRSMLNAGADPANASGSVPSARPAHASPA
jgi:ubiquinone biosynthesis protein COQ4